MKPFNLELAKQGHPVCTREGKSAKIIDYDYSTSYPIMALIGSSEEHYTYTNEGVFDVDIEEHELDLFMKQVDLFAEELPRVMEVKEGKIWKKALAVAQIGSRYIFADCETVQEYDNTKELYEYLNYREQSIEITMNQIAEKFNININQLKIIK